MPLGGDRLAAHMGKPAASFYRPSVVVRSAKLAENEAVELCLRESALRDLGSKWPVTPRRPRAKHPPLCHCEP